MNTEVASNAATATVGVAIALNGTIVPYTINKVSNSNSAFEKVGAGFHLKIAANDVGVIQGRASVA